MMAVLLATLMAPEAPAGTKCEDLAQLSLSGTTIVSARSVPPGPLQPPSGPATQALPAICRVAGAIKPSADSDIQFEVWMPVTGWNGKFQGVGNGGFAGSINYTALARFVADGYAVGSTDTGHRGEGTDARWARGHPEKVIDFGHRAIHEMTDKSKAIVRAFYSRAPERSYFHGCSNGGRQALMEAQRYPEDYDGIVAGAPANFWTHLLSKAAYDMQATVADAGAYIPASKLPAIEAAVLAACDARDGVADRIVDSPAECPFDPGTLACTAAESDSCLTPAQLGALRKLYAGPRTAEGRLVHRGFSPGGETGRGGWALWITGSEPGKALLAAFATGFFRDMLSAPPEWDVRTFALDRDLERADDTLAPVLNATDPDLDRFRRRGGKLIVYHGWADAAIAPLNAIDYYESVRARMGAGKTDGFARLFMMPGVQHCAGGPGPSGFAGSSALSHDAEHDVEKAVERWVEKGVAPDRIVAASYKADDTPSSGVARTRPLCPYPRLARWTGSGSTDDAANFVCTLPDRPPPPAEPTGPADAAVARTVAQVLKTARHPWLRWPDLSDVAPTLRDLYKGEADGLFWFAGERPYPTLPGAVEALAGADERGLDAIDLDAERTRTEWVRVQSGASGKADRALFDLAVTAGVLREIAAVHRGRVDPKMLGWGYDVRPKKLDWAALARTARGGKGVAAVLDGLEPSYPHYVRNRRELARYRALARAGEPELVPALPKGRTKVQPRQPWAGVPALRRRLAALGDLAEDAPASPSPGATPVYEGAVVEAVKRFQARHILDADGVIGAATIAALNVPLAQRVRQLELAMERGRWLPRITDRPTVFVNVPIFRLWASDPVRGEEPLRMKVVVGKAMDHRTPIFVDQMEYVIFRPYWNPPYSITTKEILPHLRRDPGYLDREALEIVASGADSARALPATRENLDLLAKGRLFVRQRPGPRNSLGLAKFIFPNSENVYMHGTPAPQLFARTRRDFSHGCIRLEDPAALAQWVLRDNPAWPRAKIDAAMQGERPTRVNLRQPLTVVLFYDTVHVNSEGVVHFVGDIYGHDRALDEALARGFPYPEAR